LQSKEKQGGRQEAAQSHHKSRIMRPVQRGKPKKSDLVEIAATGGQMNMGMSCHGYSRKGMNSF